MEVGVNSQSISSLNGIGMNGIGMNGIGMNGIGMNGPLMSDIVNYGLSSAGTDTLAGTADGAALVHYLVQCALPDGDSLTVLGVVYDGLFGVAPTWTTQTLNTSDQEAMSACLLAHVNLYGISVWISGRVHGINDATTSERQRFNNYEGAFYGNVFGATQYAYTCMGSAAPDFTVAYPNHDTTTGDRLMRRCTDPTIADPTETECGMTFTGLCSDVCDSNNGGSYSNCWTDVTRTGSEFTRAMNTWLLPYDDTDSVWPIYYDDIYGP
jgi:hypothetical protein